MTRPFHTHHLVCPVSDFIAFNMSSIIVKFQLYSTAEIYLCFVNCVCSWAISRSYTRHSFHLPPPFISPVPLSATFFSVVLFSHSYVFVLFGDLMNLNRPSCVTTCLELSMEPGDLNGGFITKDNDSSSTGTY